MPDSLTQPFDPAASDDPNEDARKGAAKRRANLFGELHLKLLEQYGPPSAVVNEAHDIVHLSENAGRYLQFVAGEPTANLVAVVHPSLRVELRTALFRAAQAKTSVRSASQAVEIDGTSEVITLNVQRVRGMEVTSGYFLVLFEKHTEPAVAPATPAHEESVARKLDGEIQFLKEQLNAAVELYEATNEELRASNEELQSVNEEMRSATAELETSKEELLSANEELTTVNHELRSSVEELSRTNSDLNNLMASTDIGTIFLDRELRIERFTPSAQKIFNLIPADMGRPLSDITHKLAYGGLLEDAEKVLRDLATIEREVSIGGKNWFLARIAPCPGAKDQIAGVVATFLDITRRKQAEDEVRNAAVLERQSRLFDTTLSSIGDLAYIFDREGRFLFANKPLTDLLGMTLEEVVGKSFFELGYPPELAEKLQKQIRHVFETKEMVRDETPFTSPTGIEGVYEYIFQPLLSGDGEVEGVAGSTRDLTERIGMEVALRESEARFRAMFEQASVGIVLVGQEENCIAANPGVCEFLGYTEEELRQMRIRDVTHPDDQAREEELTRQLMAGEITEFTIEKRYLRKDGSIVWGSMTATVVRQATGEALYTLAIVRAIGDRKLAEEKLRKSEERFRTLADNVPQLIWTNDANGKADYFNRRWYEYSGLIYEDSGEHGWEAIVHPDDGAAAKERWQQALAAGEVFDAEYRLRRHDGVYRWHIGRNVPLRGGNGNVLNWFGTATDIDDFKQAQAGLREMEGRFRLLIEGTPDYAMFLLDAESTITYWSAGAEKVFGWSAAEAVGQTGALIFTPEDRERGAVEKELANAREQGYAPDRRWHLRKDQSRLWVDGVMRRLDAPDGSVRGFAKIGRDATDLRQAEERLWEAHDQLEKRVHDRTRELQAMNETLEQEITQRQQLEQEILHVTDRERARISQDLHDSLCQELTATAFLLKSQSKATAKESETAAVALEEAARTVNSNAGLARDLARGLHPFELGSGGLVTALRELAMRTSETVTCKCECPRALRVPDENVALNIYRIAQEAVLNAVKHAKASEILISIERIGHEIVLVVTDDGTPRPKKRGAGMGIHMMQYRANVAGGTLQIEAKRGRGTNVTCRVPAKR